MKENQILLDFLIIISSTFTVTYTIYYINCKMNIVYRLINIILSDLQGIIESQKPPRARAIKKVGKMSKFEIQVKMEFIVEADSQAMAEIKCRRLLQDMEKEVDAIKPLSRRLATVHGTIQGGSH